jgi:hypothetical protein
MLKASMMGKVTPLKVVPTPGPRVTQRAGLNSAKRPTWGEKVRIGREDREFDATEGRDREPVVELHAEIERNARRRSAAVGKDHARARAREEVEAHRVVVNR